ncbi:MAG TPA: hypothetical protein VKB12_12315, partial [Pyrinomonadaceae bacterium]|nr:hypothetical protein [Pyrinomonadaceae bacterium]
MKSPVSFSLKSVSVSLALSLGVSALVAAAWGVGVLSSPAALFMFDDSSTPSVPPQAWVVLLLVASAGAFGGLAAERLGARKGLQVVVGALVVLCAASLVASRFLHLDIVFAPVMLACCGSLAAAQARRLWKIDALLAENVGRVASRPSVLEGRGASARMACGLKLLDTVLALDEAVVFSFDEQGALAQAARLRSQTQGAAANAPVSGERHSAWREGVSLCERAVASRELTV